MEEMKTNEMMTMMKMRSEEMEMAMRMTMSCNRMCCETMNYMMSMGGRMVEMDMMNMMRDCAEMCMMADQFMTRSSMMSSDMCNMCAESCDMCASMCEKMPENEMMMSCAMMCRKCAEACRQMMGMSNMSM